MPKSVEAPRHYQEGGQRGEKMKKVALTESEITEKTQEVLEFAQIGAVVNQEGVVCGDGGVPEFIVTTKGEKIRVAGMAGDLGQDAATIAAVFTFYKRHQRSYIVEETARRLVEAYNKAGLVFQFHTSKHINLKKNPQKITDCGDMNAKMTPGKAEAYDTDAAEVHQLVALLQTWYRQGNQYNLLLQEQDLGHREHHEAGVIIITGNEKTLLHWVQPALTDQQSQSDQGKMFFVLDPQRAAARRRKALQMAGFQPDEIDEIIQIKAEQDQQTNHFVAWQEADADRARNAVFFVNVDDPNNIKIEYAGCIQPDGSIK